MGAGLSIRPGRWRGLLQRLWLTGSLGMSSLGGAQDPAPSTHGLPDHYVALAPLMADLGFRSERAMTSEGARTFKNAFRRVGFQHDSREIDLDGVRVFLGEGVVARSGALWLSARDAEALVRPLLRPSDFRQTARPVRRIMIDAGHGGKDRGTHHDPLGLSEKHLTLDVAQRLGAILSAQGFEVEQTRTADEYIATAERARRAQGADVLVSIHFNAAGNQSARGSETYVLTPAAQRSTGDHRTGDEDLPGEVGNAHDPWNAVLGYEIQRALTAELGTFDRGLKRARFAVLRLSEVPAVLVEAGFLSHPAEAQELASPTRRAEIAAAIAGGIVAYANQILSLPPP